MTSSPSHAGVPSVQNPLTHVAGSSQPIIPTKQASQTALPSKGIKYWHHIGDVPDERLRGLCCNRNCLHVNTNIQCMLNYHC